MRRFFVPPENFKDSEVVFSQDDIGHMRRVLRLRVGDHVHVLDGQGLRYLVRLTEVGKDAVKGEVLAREEVSTESNVAIHLGQALLKGNAFDSVLRKSVELGVGVVTALASERCEKKGDGSPEKRERWQKIVQAASMQSGRSEVPTVTADILRVEQFCEQQQNCDLKLIFWEEEENRRLKDLSPGTVPGSIALICGPEGGLMPEEVQQAKCFGFTPVSLGSRILRAETAPIAALTLLQSIWGDM